jgi:hypothetical protein
MPVCQCSNFKFKVEFKKKMKIPSHIKKFADKATANLPVKSAGRYEAEYQK